MVQLSRPITLDSTLYDLYAEDNNAYAGDVALVYALPSAEVQIHKSIPLSRKYTYQSPLSWANDGDKLARMFLQVVPQMFGFIAGNLPLFMFDLDEMNIESYPHEAGLPEGIQKYREDAFDVMNQLESSQRPNLTFINSPSDILLAQNVKAAIISPIDCLTYLPLLVDPDGQYLIQSKRNLATSAVSTPASEVIDTHLRPGVVYDNHEIEGEVFRMVEPIQGHALPFVVKMAQSLAGQGTFVVRSETARERAISVLTTALPQVLRQLDVSNARLYPSSLVIQQFVYGEAVALSLFVTRTGRSIFIGCSRQLIDAEGHWGGGFISYGDQDRLKHLHAGIADELANYCHKHGYFGPIATDVMMSEDGHMLAIDPNPRVGGSTPLGLLKTHFAVERGMQEAAIFFPLLLKCSRGEFNKLFASELQEGSVIVAGWCHDRLTNHSETSIIVGAKTQAELAELISRINRYKIAE